MQDVGADRTRCRGLAGGYLEALQRVAMPMSNLASTASPTGSSVALADADDVAAAGVIHLSPVQNSVDRSPIAVAVRLSGDDGKLRFGDLRAAAVALDERGEHEAAHRLWILVGTAAFKAGDLVLATKADERADRSRGLARGAGAPSAGRLAKYDYDALVNDRASGMSIAETAKRWGCSPTTVKRASQYVEVRNLMLQDRPGLIRDIESGSDVSDLAKRYDVEPKIMRWIVVSHFDRRSTERPD